MSNDPIVSQINEIRAKIEELNQVQNMEALVSKRRVGVHASSQAQYMTMGGQGRGESLVNLMRS